MVTEVGGATEPPTHIWRTFVGRSAFEFQIMLHSKDAGLFLNIDHIEGVAKQRASLMRTSMVIYFLTLFIAFILLAELEVVDVSINLPLIEVSGMALTGPLLLFVMSTLVVYYCALLVDLELLRRQVQSIFEHVGLPAPQAISRANYVASRWAAGQLWMDVVTFHPTGYKSGIMHLIASLFLLLAMLSFSLIQSALILIAAYTAFGVSRADGGFAYYWVTWPSIVMLHVSICFTVLAIAVPLRFKFFQPTQKSSITSI